jgi:hypothetical protein
VKLGTPKIDGFILMEVAMRGPEHPHGPELKAQYALIQQRDDGLSTCGKLSYEALPLLDAWPVEVREAYEAFVETLEDHFLSDGGIFTEGIERTEVVHATVTGPEPEDF